MFSGKFSKFSASEEFQACVEQDLAALPDTAAMSRRERVARSIFNFCICTLPGDVFQAYNGYTDKVPDMPHVVSPNAWAAISAATVVVGTIAGYVEHRAAGSLPVNPQP